MTRERLPASAIHLRIGRLVVDAGVLGDGGVPGDLDARLREALASHLEQRRSPAAHAPGDWIGSIAREVVSGMREAPPGGSR